MLYSDHHFSTQFSRNELEACRQNLASLTTFNLVAMSGAGITFFLKALAQTQTNDFLFINSYEMHDFTKAALYQQLAEKLGLDGEQVTLSAIRQALADKAASQDRLVLVFNRLDRLHEILDQNFYDNMRFLRDGHRNKIVMIFVSSRPIFELSGAPIKDGLSLVTKTHYFAGYTDEDLREISESSGGITLSAEVLRIAGGHHALSQVLQRCQNLDNPLSDPLVELLIKDLYYGLDMKRRRQLEAFALKRVTPKDQLLTAGGYIRNNGTFTPLLTDYLKQAGSQHLPIKEKQLLRLLLLHHGKVVSKQAICDHVWKEENGVVSDWALNALIYRLRRHPAFDGQRYVIESRKKDGYVLYDLAADK